VLAQADDLAPVVTTQTVLVDVLTQLPSDNAGDDPAQRSWLKQMGKPVPGRLIALTGKRCR
ncbi:MAG: hypothetical protein WCA32_07350, partial [Chromatiaceae bacterium]